MMNCTLRRQLMQPRTRGANLRALLGFCIGLVVLALLWVQPVAAQVPAVGPVYALPGTLTPAVNRSYGTILTTADSTQYGLVGQTPILRRRLCNCAAWVL